MNTLFIRLSTHALLDAKLLAAGPEGFTLWIKGLLWSKEQLKDGVIEQGALPLIGLGLQNPQATADLLVSVGLWQKCDEGWTVGADKWSMWQNTKADVEKSRQAARDRQAKSRQQKALSQKSHADVTRDNREVTQPETETETENIVSKDTREPASSQRPEKARTWKTVECELADLLPHQPRGVLSDWCAFKSESKGKVYTPKGTVAWANEYGSWEPSRLRKAIDHTMANGYQGIVEPKAVVRMAVPTPGPPRIPRAEGAV